MPEDEIKRYFGFLEKEYGFKKLPQYNYVRELHTDFIKDNIIVKIIFEGSYIIEVFKLKVDNSGLINGTAKVVQLSKDNYASHYLSELGKPDASSKGLEYYSSVLKANAEILHGNFSKFSTLYSFFKFLGLR